MSRPTIAGKKVAYSASNALEAIGRDAISSQLGKLRVAAA